MGNWFKKNWKYLPGVAGVGVAEGLFKAAGGDGLTNDVRRNHTRRTLEGQKHILDQYDQYSDESGVRGEMAKYSQLADMFGQEAGKSYLDTTEGRSFTRQIEDTSQKNADRLRSDKGLMNLSSEAYLAGMGKINEQEGASMNQLVAGSDARKRALRSQQMMALSQVLGGEQGLYGAQQARFMNSFNAANGLYGTAQQMQNQSNQALMNLGGGLLDAGVAAAGVGA